MRIRRPVDMGDNFRKNMTLITDPRSDRYLNEYSKLATSLKEGAEKAITPAKDKAKDLIDQFKEGYND